MVLCRNELHRRWEANRHRMEMDLKRLIPLAPLYTPNASSERGPDRPPSPCVAPESAHGFGVLGP